MSSFFCLDNKKLYYGRQMSSEWSNDTNCLILTSRPLKSHGFTMCHTVASLFLTVLQILNVFFSKSQFSKKNSKVSTITCQKYRSMVLFLIHDSANTTRFCPGCGCTRIFYNGYQKCLRWSDSKKKQTI